MKVIVYSEMVQSLSKSGHDILKELSPTKCEMWHHASCIQGEAGEIFDVVKKHIIYNKEWTEENQNHLIEELGDLEFYLEGLRQAFRINRQVCLDRNAEKLAKRYGDDFQYSNESAQLRKDKEEIEKSYRTLT